jgi:transcriptional regulator with XRE-family HTH domain
MEEPTLVVAQNLRRMREDKKLSLDRLAELTGVSKSMLGQIERGESSPTISTIWKIANGLKVSFTSLLNTPQNIACTRFSPSEKTGALKSIRLKSKREAI